MNKKQKVISQPLAKKIYDKAKEKGFELPESEMWWVLSKFENEYILKEVIMVKEYINKYAENGNYPAFDCAELGEMLPEGYISTLQIDFIGIKSYYGGKWLNNSGNVAELFFRINGDKTKFKAKTEAEVRGKMLIYLISNKLI